MTEDRGWFAWRRIPRTLIDWGAACVVAGSMAGCAMNPASAPPSQAIAAAPTAPAPAGADSCSGCHPVALRADSAVPRLAGLDRQAIIDAMRAFRAGQRPATVMDRIAKGFDDAEIQAIAAWYAAQR